MMPKHRRPTHPGEMLLKEFLEPTGTSSDDFAAKLQMPSCLVDDLIAGRGDVTPELADHLAAVLGTSPQLWMNLQRDWAEWRPR